MKKLLILVSSLIASVSLAAAGGAGWSENFEEAKELAKKENKAILLDFTGSDWCGWCIKLNDEVFSKKAFKDYAKDKLVLVEVDFPQEKRQSKKLKEQNDELRKKYQITGYPSIVLIDAEGKVIAQTGYKKGGPEAYVTHLKGLLGNKG